jgi:signal transduction histidine kinase/streptogramin lyase
VGRREGLPAEIFSLLEDREGGLWIGTGVGVVRWAGEAIVNFDTTDGIPGTFVLGVSADVDGAVWVSSAQGASRIVGASQHSQTITVENVTRQDGLPNEEVWQVLRDSRGRLWIATADGLCLYQERRGCRVWTEDDGLPTNFVGVLIEAANGDLVVGASGGVVRFEFDERGDVAAVTPIAGHPSLEAANIYSIVEDASQALWIATDAGLFHHGNGATTILGAECGLPRRGINDLVIDEAGGLWVATSGMGVAYAGASQLDGPRTRFSTFTSRNGLPSNTVISIVEGDDGAIWAGTAAGVAEIDGALARENADLVVQRQLTSASGLLGSEPGSGGAFCRSSDGTFWFGLARGVSHYDPSKERGFAVPPSLEIGRVIANRSTIRVAPYDQMQSEPGPTPSVDGVTLTHRSNDIVFEYRALSFHDPSRVTYQVRLDGLDTAWSDPTPSRFKEYTHLPPGDYVFRVRAISAAGLLSEEDAVFPVTIRPPFWQTEWFPAVVLVALAMLVAAVVQLRSYAVKRHNEELAIEVAMRTSDLELRTHELEAANARIIEDEKSKSRFLAGMSHELRTPLNSIIGFTELMLGREEDRESRQAKFLGNVNHSAHQLLGLINDLLDLSKIEAGKMEVFIEPVALPPLLESVVSTLEPLSTPRRIEVVRELPDMFPVVKLDPNKVRQILYNLVSNAIKFSPPGSSIHVAIRDLDPGASPLEEDSLVIEVEDGGINIPKDEIQTIFDEYHQSPTVSSLGLGTGLGLAIVRKFAELQGGFVQVEPNDHGGSTFRVWLPQNAVRYETDSGPHSALSD